MTSNLNPKRKTEKNKIRILYSNKQGNALIVDSDGKLCGINDEGNMLGIVGFEVLLSEYGSKYGKIKRSNGVYYLRVEND